MVLLFMGTATILGVRRLGAMLMAPASVLPPPSGLKIIPKFRESISVRSNFWLPMTISENPANSSSRLTLLPLFSMGFSVFHRAVA